MSGENQECGRCGLDVSAGIHVRPEDCIRALRSKLSTADPPSRALEAQAPSCVCGRCHAAPTMATTAESSRVCGKAYQGGACRLPLGHAGHCQD
jgi:hypothetical protein